MAQCGQNMTQMSQNSPKWTKMVQDEPKWQKMKQNEPTGPKNDPKWPHLRTLGHLEHCPEQCL